MTAQRPGPQQAAATQRLQHVCRRQRRRPLFLQSKSVAHLLLTRCDMYIYHRTSSAGPFELTYLPSGLLNPEDAGTTSHIHRHTPAPHPSPERQRRAERSRHTLCKSTFIHVSGSREAAAWNNLALHKVKQQKWMYIRRQHVAPSFTTVSSPPQPSLAGHQATGLETATASTCCCCCARCPSSYSHASSRGA